MRDATSNAEDTLGTDNCRAERNCCLAAVLAAAVAGLAWPADAAPPAGSIEGQATDALQRPLAGAQLHVETPDGRTAGRAVSDATGHFVLRGIAPGTYSVIAEKPGFDAASAIVTLDAAAGASADLVLASKQSLDLTVTTQKLDEARNSIQPRLGTSVYAIDQKAIENSPQGNNAAFNEVLLQAPGVAKDSFGQLHVRGDHGNLQFRINGVLLPEGISGFGQVLDSRFANRADLITGALPAQYGYRTAGVVDIQTKSGAFDNVSSVGMYGGSYGTLQPSFETMGSHGNANYYVSGSFLQDDIGIESPTGDHDTIHDRSRQSKGFLYASDLLDPSTRLSVIAGTSIGNFQIPNRPGQTPNFTAFGVSNFDSAALNENQKERNHYGIVALQQSHGDLDYQVATFTRYSTINFTPDPLGDLIFNGVASRVTREDFANGLQGDGSYRLAETHTLRGGFFASGERAVSLNTSTVEPVVGGNAVDAPFAIQDDHAKFGWLYGLYLQDEWRLTDALTLNYGARFDLMDEFVRAHQFSPRVNAVYKPFETTTLHAGYARYFTPAPLELIAPTSVAKFNNTTNASQVTTDSLVQPDRSHYFDAGVVQQVTPELQLGLDAYYKLSRHLLDEGQFGTALVFSPFNYAHGRVYGVEFTGTYHLEKFTAYGNLGVSRAQGKRIESSEFVFNPDDLKFISTNYIRLDHDQTYTASGGVSYDLDGTLLSVDAIYGSGLRRTAVGSSPNSSHLPDYVQVNLGASHAFSTQTFGNLTARFDILNIFDQKYEIRDGTGIGVGAPQFGIRRAYFAGLTKEF
jgi:outer membrane receptor protein involved in Fe transport